MADFKEKEKEIKEALVKEREQLKETYNEILSRLKTEGEKLQGDIQKEYENARKYVEKNPEAGIGAALVGGLLIGFAIAKLFKN